MQKKLQVFVSSTYKDLRLERQRLVEAILLAGHIPAGMELFGSEDKSQWEVIRHWIDDSDVFVLLVGGLYGSVEKKSRKSYVQKEFEYARKRKMPLFKLVLTNDYLNAKLQAEKLPHEAVFETENPELHKTFKKMVMDSMCVMIHNLDQIEGGVFRSMRDIDPLAKLSGWIRSDSPQSKLVQAEMARLKNENEMLQSRFNDVHTMNLKQVNEAFVVLGIPGPIVQAVFPDRSREEQLEVQRKVVMFLNQLNYLSASWADWQEYRLLSQDNWEQRLTWYKNVVWDRWIKSNLDLQTVNSHLIATDDFQNKKFGKFYKDIVKKWHGRP